MARLKFDWVELRHFDALDHSLPTRTDKVACRLQLPDDPDTLWHGLKAKVRNQIRKAQRHELTVHTGRPPCLDDFYALYCRNMRDLGSPPHSRRFFEQIIDTFAAQATIFVVRHQDRPLAAGLTLSDCHGTCLPWAASDRKHSQLCGNMLLYWTMLTDACRNGSPAFDFGRATRDSGTHRFKTQWGAGQQTLHWHYLLAPGKPMPELRADSPRYRFMVASWKRLPVAAAKTIGPHLIAKLS